MKKRFAVIAILIGLNCASAQAEGTPKIQFDRTEYDIGTTSLVQFVTGTFTFQNVGDAELQVQKPQSDCGCTVVEVKPDRLKPGDKGEVVFTLNALAIRGPTQKFITVPSNDPKQPELKLTIKGNVTPTFEITPAQVMLDALHVEDSTNVTVTVKRVDGRKLVITTVEVSDPAIRARLEPVGDSDQTARFRVEVQAGSAPRWFSGSVLGSTDDSQGAAFSIPVNAQFAGDVVITPEQLVWSIADEDEPAENPKPHRRSISISAGRGDQPLELRNPTSDLKNLAVEVETVEIDRTYNVVLTLTGLPKEPVTGAVRLETNLASQPKIVVPVTIKVIRP